MKRFVYGLACAAIIAGMTMPALTGCGSKEVRIETGDLTESQKEMLEGMSQEERQQFMKDIEQSKQNPTDPVVLLPESTMNQGQNQQNQQ